MFNKNFANKNSCNKDNISEPFEVIAVNTAIGSDDVGVPTHVSFNNINGNILQTIYTNINTNNFITNYNPINTNTSTGNWNIFSGIWSGIQNLGIGIWNGIKGIGNWFGNLFTSKNNCTGIRSKLAMEKNNDVGSNCDDNTNRKNTSNKASKDYIEVDFKILLPNYLFENTKLAKKGFTITNEDIDCACENNDPFGIANYLGLEFEETLFLLQPENNHLLQQICKCIKDNNYSTTIREKIKADLILLNKQQSPLNSCLKINDCEEGYVRDKNGNRVKKPCPGDPVPNPEIAPQTNSGIQGGLHDTCARVNEKYTCKGIRGKKWHNGVDIKNPYGSPVFAIYGGTATKHTQRDKKTRKLDGAGYYVAITSNVNGKRVRMVYFHLQYNNRFTGTINAGDIIGYQGDSGNLKAAIKQKLTVSHVHIKAEKNGARTNPLNHFKTTIDPKTGKTTNPCQ